MTEINLSNTPNTSALIVVRGDVQDNHVHNFGKVMRYGNVAVVSTAELEDAMPTVGMSLRYRGDRSEMQAQAGHRQNCAEWIAGHVSEEFGLEPFKYDVHLLDGASATPDNEGLDADRSHWQSVTQRLATRQPLRLKQDGGSGIWTYKPFELTDKGLERFAQQETGERPVAEELLDKLQSARYPVRFSYAAATLLPDRLGKLHSAEVTFGYPTTAKFQRLQHAESGTVNQDGDRVHVSLESSSRIFQPKVPIELQAALDDANAAGDAAEARAKQRQGDEDFFIMNDHGTTNYNIEALLAPIHNLI